MVRSRMKNGMSTIEERVIGIPQQLKVWWIPQIPGKSFEVPVSSVDEAKKILTVLADYDAFQYDNNTRATTAMRVALLSMTRTLMAKAIRVGSTGKTTRAAVSMT
ncbi:hypothetical protein CIW54_07560 [Paraburkholderia sp. T12-10]|nr:hypothetical protein CIW54_07560 [Paraburkholderia sp. T12-10]